ncbi:MAG: 2-hydroxyacyl-CoA dehydratase subunit D [Desulfurispora sp.]|uniref:2-hydroxyacyl-CoA dehydratase subunit D n=1 Tax=Desulfurispora sp. TaxID=3014275 RepID=UPI00404AB5B0
MRLGYFCSYTPEEIIMAAGCQPVRLFPTCAPGGAADRHLQTFACGYARSALEYLLGGSTDGLDGVIIPAACDSMRAVAEILRLTFPARFVFFLNLPLRLDSPAAAHFYCSELAALLLALEQYTGRSVTAQQLEEAIALMANLRVGLGRLWYGVEQAGQAGGMAEIAPPAVPGTDCRQAAENAGQEGRCASWHSLRRFVLLQRWLGMDRQAALSELQELLLTVAAERSEEGAQTAVCPPVSAGSPVLAIGASLADVAWLEILEKGGLKVVGDDLCSGSRYFVSLPEPAGRGCPALISGEEPGGCSATGETHSGSAVPQEEKERQVLLADLAGHYINRIPCPTKFPAAPKRELFWQWLQQHCRPVGVVYFQNIYCEPHGFDFPHLKAWWAEKGLPLLRLDVEPGRPPGEAELTRVQAFAEMLGGGKA